jgi:putative iron-regulated protein
MARGARAVREALVSLFRVLAGSVALGALMLAGPAGAQPATPAPAPAARPAAATAPAAQPATPSARAVATTYADIALAMYTDAQTTARALQGAVDRFLADPTPATLAAARDAWKAARVPYQQTEALRFGNRIVDDWEGKVNAWPLDEGFIDYVAPAYGETSEENPLYRANLIANPRIRVGRRTVDARRIDAGLIERLQEAGGVESNVTIGYHAIEFLLWGQDLNGTGPGAGNRPATDYSTTACTGGNCDRRRAYLKAATDLLVTHIGEMVRAFGPNGAARRTLLRQADRGNGSRALVTIFTGLGSLSYGELAGERMKLGLILHDPEEEHDCFADNTHNSHFYNQVGMVAFATGVYRRLDGTVVSGPSVMDIAHARAPAEARRLGVLFTETSGRMAILKSTADSGRMAYDQMLAAGNKDGNAIVQGAIDALIAQARGIEAVVGKLGLRIEVEGSDSLDNPSAVRTP